MTGFGNNAFKVLQNNRRVKLVGVITPQRHKKPFPHYACKRLAVVVENTNINLFEGLILKDSKTCQLIKQLSADLIVVSSFNQIIPGNIIGIPQLGVINIHPSLLPKYRGPTPTVWSLANGEKYTGLSIHFIEDDNKIDAGKIISQVKVKIEFSDNNGTLMQKLAYKSENLLTSALEILIRGNKKTEFKIQNEEQASYYPRRLEEDAKIDLKMPFKKIRDKIRAMSPYPGAYLENNGRRYIVYGATLLTKKNKRSNIKISHDDKKFITTNTPDGLVEFYTVERI